MQSCEAACDKVNCPNRSSQGTRVKRSPLDPKVRQVDTSINMVGQCILKVGAVDPPTIIRLKALRQCVRRASGRDGYGRASDKFSVWQATPKAHDYIVKTEAKCPLDHGAAMR
eukprot:6195521-Pleurochrysis_carterae.AAC.9